MPWISAYLALIIIVTIASMITEYAQLAGIHTGSMLTTRAYFAWLPYAGTASPITLSVLFVEQDMDWMRLKPVCPVSIAIVIIVLITVYVFDVIQAMELIWLPMDVIYVLVRSLNVFHVTHRMFDNATIVILVMYSI